MIQHLNLIEVFPTFPHSFPHIPGPRISPDILGCPGSPKALHQWHHLLGLLHRRHQSVQRLGIAVGPKPNVGPGLQGLGALSALHPWANSEGQGMS